MLRALLSPFIRLFKRFFDPRFAALAHRVEALEAESRGLSTLVHELTDHVKTTRDLTERGLLAVTEGLTYTDRTLSNLTTSSAIRMAPRDSSEPVVHLSEVEASFLEHAAGPLGPRAQAGLHVDDPLEFEYSSKGVRVRSVGATLIELPFTYRTLAGLAPGSVIVDLGANGRSMAFGLASLGHRVYAVDTPPYPFTHPNLTTVPLPLDDWPGPGELVDGVVYLTASKLHGQVLGERPEAAQAALHHLFGLCRPGGILTFTASLGASGDVAPPLDMAAIERVLGGWQTDEVLIAVRTGSHHWSLTADLEPPGRAGGPTIALIRASKPG